MPLGSAERPRTGLGVLRMALALVAAAFLGASLGLVWQSSGLGRSAEEKAAEAREQEEQDLPEPPTSG